MSDFYLGKFQRLPLSSSGLGRRPFTAVTQNLIWQFTSAGSDFLFAAFLTGGNPRLSVVTTSLNFLNGGAIVSYCINTAAAVTTSLPTFIAYISLGRYFIRGILPRYLKSQIFFKK